MPVCVFDIFPDGTAQVPADRGLTGQGSYRWWHFDVADPEFEPWIRERLHEIPAEALLQSETRPRCDRFEDGLILNLRGINLNEGQSFDRMVSVRMWATESCLVTARVRRVFAVDDIRSEIAAGRSPMTVARFIDALVTRLVDRVEERVLVIMDQSDTFEESVTHEDEDHLPAGLGAARRSVIRLLRYLEPQRAALQKLAGSDAPLLTEADRLDLRELANRAAVSVEELSAIRERLASVQDHHDTQATLRQGRNGYVLSVIAAIFLPLGFLTGLFGVNVGGMPGVGSPVAFALLSLAMAVIALLVVLVMRWKRWL
ncbi:zinc transporter ZntB [Sulfitobacter sp. D35]|uniref:zinc transporter ZntB n=1 Tax=Sulfitobacter sp. D35 TaxID=3083252 RepID=UPI00296E3209|nr:zinc transporter ZntB [Sulfitobacter sp. D35]MDW4500128.1 zinc transporter ZntB [Sulfitobacter sp. D35]